MEALIAGLYLRPAGRGKSRQIDYSGQSSTGLLKRFKRVISEKREPRAKSLEESSQFPIVAQAAEEAIAGYCINDPVNASQLLIENGFNVENLVLPVPRAIVAHVLDFAAVGKTADFVSIATKLGEALPGTSSAVITEYSTLGLMPRFAGEWIRTVKDYAARREALRLNQAQLERLKTGADLPDVAAHLATWAQSVVAQTVTAPSDWRSLWEKRSEAYFMPPDPNQLIRTGFSGWDERFTVERGDYMVIGGATGAGKSMLGIQLACQMLEGSQNAGLICSLEMPAEQIVDRITARESGIWVGRLKRRQLMQGDETRLAAAFNRIGNMPLHIRDDCHTITQILSAARALHARKGLRVLVVDYLQIVRGPDKELREQQVASISRDLRLLAIETQCVVIALCQLNKLGEARESQAITMDATHFLSIYRSNKDGKRWTVGDDVSDEDQTKRIVEVRKLRDGQPGEMEMGFNGACSRFLEL